MAESPHPIESVDAHGCPVKQAEATSPPLFQNGVLTFQAHHVGWIMSGFFTLSAIGLSIWLIGKHLQWYTNKRTQRQIIRLLIMVPLYAIISFLAYFFWDYALPLTLIRDAYEGVILAAFFYLLLNYLAPTQAEQKEYFRHYTLKRWCWPFGWVKSKPDGLYFLQMMKWGILQYCWIRPLTTLGAIILDKVGYYCETSWSPKFGSVLIIVSLSVTIAMYCLIQFYLAISDRIKHHRPVLQLFSVKAIIFLMFWQSTFLSVLHSLNVVKDTKYMTAEEINIGFAALLQTFEMMLFAFLHLYCFSYKPYRETDPKLQTPRWKSLSHALDFRDYWRETADGSVYMWRIARGKEAEIEARRLTHLEKAMGRGRSRLSASNNPSAAGVGTGHRREGRALLDDDPEELWDFDATSPTERRVLNLKLDTGRPFYTEIDDARVPHRGGGDVEPGHVREKGSWWRRMYHQLSTHDREEGPSRDVGRVQNKVQQWQASVVSPISLVGGKAKGKSKSTNNRPEERGQIDLDSPPPPSFFANPRLVTKVETEVEGLQPQSKLTPLPPVIPADENGIVLSPPPVPVKENSNNKLPSSLERGLSPPLSPGVELRSVDSVLARMFAGPMEYSSSEEEEPRNTHTVGSPKDKGKGRAAQKPSSEGSHTPVGTTKDVQVSPDSPQAATPTPLARSGSPPRRGVPLPVPFQPTPIPHASLSNASRPEVLRLSDEQIELKAVAIPAGLVHAVEPALYPGLRNQTSQPTKKGRIHDARPHEVKERDRDITPKFASGPRRPQKIVLPTPLSPARYPEGGDWAAAGDSGFRRSVVDPREFGFGIPPQSHSQPSSQSQTSIQARWPSTRNSRHWKRELEPPNRMPPSHIGPPPRTPRVIPEFVPPRFVGASPPMKQLRSVYEPLPPGAGSAPGSPQVFNDTYRYTTSHPPRPQVRTHHDSASRDVPSKYGYPAAGSSRRQHNGQQHYSPDSRPSRASNLPNSGRHRPPDVPARPSKYRNRSHSPFGIDPLESDLESLPRHPAVRPQVARMRRESFPNPCVSDGRSSRRISEPRQPLFTSRVASPTSPVASSPPLLSPLNDSRYPITGSRPTYFDKYDSTEFLTTLTTQSPPVLPGNDNPYPDVLPPILSTPGKKLKGK